MNASYMKQKIFTQQQSIYFTLIYNKKYITSMAEILQKQITFRLKKKTCPQKHCPNNNQDNLELIVFAKENAKRAGFMCSQCFLDSELLAQIQPVEKHSISIKKFMKTLTVKYKQYLDEKNSVNWGPFMLKREWDKIRQLLRNYEEILFRGTKQIVSHIEDMEKKTIEEIKTLYKDEPFEKLVKLLAEQDFEEIQRTNVSAELKVITSNIMQVEGQYKMANEKELKDKHDAIMVNYRKNFRQAKECFEKLMDVQKTMLKELTAVEAESNL